MREDAAGAPAVRRLVGDLRDVTYGDIGEEYLRRLVDELGRRLDLALVFVGLFQGTPARRVRTYAVARRGLAAEAFDYLLEGTPCEGVANGQACLHADGVAKAYPNDATLRQNGLRSYAGLPLRDSRGGVLGLLVAADDRPFDDAEGLVRGLEELAPRAGAELEWVRRDEALRASEQRYRRILEALAEGILVTEVDGIVVDCNERALQILGLTRSQLEGRSLLDASWKTLRADGSPLAPADRPTLASAFRGHGSTVQTIGVRHPDGATRWLRINARPLSTASGRTSGAVVSFEDVTDSRRLERLLDETQHVAHVAGWEIDLDTDRIFLTPYGRELLEVGADWQPTRESLVDFIPEGERERVVDGWCEALESGARWSADVEITTARGRARWVRLTMGPEDGAPARRRFGTAQDITEARLREDDAARLEVQLLQAQKMEAIGTLAGGIAHDFNNILAAIVGHAEIARFELDRAEVVAQALDEILRASQRARDLVSQILTFSRKQVQARRPMKVSSVVREALTLLRATVPVTTELTGSIADGEPMILGDGTRLHQVLLNLATNSAHAIGSRPGSIAISLDVVTHATDALLPQRLHPGRYVRVRVADTGAGMDEATLQRAFEPFFTTKGHGQGSGLGLPVVLGIVESHEGAVTVESHPGQGTTFHLYFPGVADAAASEAAPASVTGPGSRVLGRVLFIDDEVAILDVGRRMLGRLGLECETFNHPSAALDAFRSSPSRWDLVITDYALPGLAGTTVAETIQTIRPGMPVVLTTGYAGGLSAEEQAQASILAVLPKPFSFADLAALVERILAK